MKWLMHCLKYLWMGKNGATTAEYALLLALVVIILISSLTALGQALQNRLQDIIQSINAA